jgi:shikimate kinase/3-dehydroquinate synthase
VVEVRRVVLIGFSGTGKTKVARLLAERLGWSVADTDAAIEEAWGSSIPSIFRDAGEASFRRSERAALADAVARDHVVVATGGGAVVGDQAWGSELLGREGTLVVALEAGPETVLDRLREQAASEGEALERPMLAGADPLGRVRALKEQRQPFYDRAGLTISTEGASAESVAAELEQAVRSVQGEPLHIRLDADSASSDIVVMPGALSLLGTSTRERWPKARSAWIITDENVGPQYSETATRVLGDEGFCVQSHAVAAGEGSKSLGTAGELFDWLLGNDVERGDVVVALGGGVVGDLAGFVAATVLRGIGLVQAPTSLLAAVDSSVGGKTGINHPVGKNLIGAFLQPPLVVVDTSLLQSMPPRELRSGWGEVVKHAVIQRSTPGGERGDLRCVLKRNAKDLKCLAEPATSYVVARNIALKAVVVAADERESGIRAYLNFGHTVGHAIEASGYSLLHGEAVAVGMCAAARLGVLMETCREDEATSIEQLVADFDLPRAAAFDPDEALTRLQSDKKRVAGRQRFVLPLDGGGVTIRDDVPIAAVAQVLESVRLDLISA